jgi:hypothetical protein
LKRNTKSEASRQSPVNGRDRISRLFLLLDAKLGLLEQRHHTDRDMSSSTDNEKDARAMMSLIRVYEKLVEIKERLDGGGPDSGDHLKGSGSDEAEQIRRDLAQRIERLQRKHKSDTGDTETPER